MTAAEEREQLHTLAYTVGSAAFTGVLILLCRLLGG